MKLVLKLGAIESRLGRKRVIERICEDLGLRNRQTAMLRLDRALSGETETLRKDILAELFQLAQECGVPWTELLTIERPTVFDLLPGPNNPILPRRLWKRRRRIDEIH